MTGRIFAQRFFLGTGLAFAVGLVAMAFIFAAAFVLAFATEGFAAVVLVGP